MLVALLFYGILQVVTVEVRREISKRVVTYTKIVIPLHAYVEPDSVPGTVHSIGVTKPATILKALFVVGDENNRRVVRHVLERVLRHAEETKKIIFFLGNEQFFLATKFIFFCNQNFFLKKKINGETFTVTTCSRTLVQIGTNVR